MRRKRRRKRKRDPRPGKPGEGGAQREQHHCPREQPQGRRAYRPLQALRQDDPFDQNHDEDQVDGMGLPEQPVPDRVQPNGPFNRASVIVRYPA